ncbi:hypothetical protein AQUCO_04300035v1, partial [Aquilegia coerulea]
GFLRDPEGSSSNNQVLEIWVASFKHLAYRVEDVINAYNLEMERRKKRHIVLRLIGFWKWPKALHRFGKEIEGINKEANEIATNRSLFYLDTPRDHNDNLAAIRKNAFDDDPVIVGFHKQAEKLIDSLVMKEEKPRCRIMSIVGMRGLGKTRLAKMIYGRREVKNHFNARAMIYASQLEYQLSCLQGLNDGDLKIELKRHLQGKRYLVVIDEVWKKETWMDIGVAFPEDGNGSRVLLTTRNEDVAIHADPWELFCTKVFSGPGTCPPDLVEVGEKIVKKCRGLPLAIVVLGGIVLGKDRTKNACMAILALSYTDLPDYLKSCFLYLGIFPEDFEIDVRKLILLWVVQDFVQMHGEQKTEDVAEDCFIELIHRSLIQVAKRKYHGGPAETCRVHDLLRDLAILKGKLTLLQYLGLRRTGTEEVPSSICNLVNLQTLDARKVFINIRMTKEIWKMKQLKHFHLELGWICKILTKLDLEGCVLVEDPSHVLEGLPNLMELRIRNGSYIGKEMLFSAQGFKQLQFIQLHELGRLQRPPPVEEESESEEAEEEVEGAGGAEILRLVVRRTVEAVRAAEGPGAAAEEPGAVEELCCCLRACFLLTSMSRVTPEYLPLPRC